jgi:hypothetical protein
MPRVGLPATPAKRSARSLATLRRSAPNSSPIQILAVAAGAIAFRLVSALVAAFVSRLVPREAAEVRETTFGIAPLITQSVERGLGHGHLSASTVLAWLAFAAAMALLLRLAQLDVDGDRADAAVLLAAVFPFAAVFGQSVADTLFFAAAIAAFYNIRRQRWLVAGACGAVATAAIPTGVLILPALGWIGLRDPSARHTWAVVIGLLLAAAGCGGSLAYAYYLGGPPGGWIVAAREWGLQMEQAPWAPLLHLFRSPLPPVAAMSSVMALMALAAVPLVWWRLNGGYAIYMLAMLWLPLMSGRYDSLGITCALLFPLFVLVATIRSRVVVTLIAVASSMFYAIAIAYL